MQAWRTCRLSVVVIRAVVLTPSVHLRSCLRTRRAPPSRTIRQGNAAFPRYPSNRDPDFRLDVTGGSRMPTRRCPSPSRTTGSPEGSGYAPRRLHLAFPGALTPRCAVQGRRDCDFSKGTPGPTQCASGGCNGGLQCDPQSGTVRHSRPRPLAPMSAAANASPPRVCRPLPSPSSRSARVANRTTTTVSRAPSRPTSLR